MKGHQSAGNSNSNRSATPKEGRPKQKKDNGGDVQHLKKECGKCGCIHSGEMSSSGSEREDTWSRTAHRIGVRLEVMLILGLIPRMLLQPSLLKGTNSTPSRARRSKRSLLMWSHVCCKFSQPLFMIYLI